MSDDTRARIVDVATSLLREHGAAAVSTRRVAHGAGVQAPTIYRLFGDKDGLLDAVAEQVLATYVTEKASVIEAAAAADVDPLDDLRTGWRTQIDFGVGNPALFALLSAPERARTSPSARAALEVLQARVRRMAAAGLLRVSEPRAVDMIRAAGSGAVLTLLTSAPDARDPALADAMLDSVLAQILVAPPAGAAVSAGGALPAAVALRAQAPDLGALTDAERRLLADWLDRVIAAPEPAAAPAPAPAPTNSGGSGEGADTAT
ncbi:TetR family transcriptional regulator [Subtercola sp. Z020]|uniref:TetR/AcrR family transcriptional regulator n=1 Tax=Subtercola sp. Z020 TaxID=2080582 RepID=UPI000CE7711D|nr:TetR/AcrR family transcriptional regulator [Subtercola sp. Z020]PPF78310.1 TetR family transcriptional regulator [Subtercola sp. Z020]